jgi:hypothetical protein
MRETHKHWRGVSPVLTVHLTAFIGGHLRLFSARTKIY